MSFKKIEKPSKGESAITVKTSIPFIIGIGISNDSLEPLQNFLLHLPDEIKNAAIIIALHPGYSHKSMLMQFLKGQSKMLTEPAVNRLVLESNRIYIAPAGKVILIKKGRFCLSRPTVSEKPGPDMDLLFQSIALEAKELGIGIIFSTNGKDGAAGLNAIDNAGGLAITQGPGSLRHNGRLLSISKKMGADSVFKGNNVSSAIRNFILQQKKQVNIKKTFNATNSKKNAESKEWVQMNNGKPKTDISLRKKHQEENIKNQQLLKLAESISHVGSWELNLQTNKMVWSDELYKIFGFKPGEFEPSNEIRFSLIHSEDRNTVSGIYKNAIETGGEYFFEKRILRPDGNIRHILSQGRVEKDENGLPLKLAGIFKDITQEKQLRENLEQSAAYFKGAFDNSAIGMALVGLDGSWKEANDSLCKMVGYSKKELLKLTFQDITHPEDLILDLEYLNELIDGKRESYQMEKRYFHKNGDIIWILLVVSMVKDKEGKVLHFISQLEDITNRKRIEEALRSSEEKYRLLFYSSPLPKWIYDIETFEIMDVNEPAIDHYGYNRKEFLNMTIKDIRTKKEIPELKLNTKNTNHKKGIVRFGITEHLKKNGDIIKVEISGHPIRFNERNCMIVICNDVTEKQMAEEALQLSNERYRYVTKATFDAIWDWDLKNDTIYLGEGFQTLFGYDNNNRAADKNSWSKLIHPDDFLRVNEGILKLIAGSETIWSAEYRYLKANGEYAFVADKALVVREENGDGVRMIGAMQDITRKKSEEQQLKLFESVITNTRDGVMITGAESFNDTWPNIVYVNAAFTRMTGYSKEDLIGKTPRILQGPKSDKKALSQLRQSMEKRENCEIETINYKKNGEEFWVNFSIMPMVDEKGWFSHWIAITRDITQRKRQEAEKEVFFNLVQSLGKLELGEAWINILENICIYSGFDYAEAWMVNIDQSHLLLHKEWTNNCLTEKLIVTEKVIKIKKGEGLTGNAWVNNKVDYINDITNHTAYPAKKFAIERKLNSVAYIPVLFKGNAIALLSFYSGSIEIDNSNFKNLFDTISQQLGPYVQSKRAEDELAKFFNLSPDFLAIAGTDGYFKKINPSFTRILGYSSKELFDKPISDFTHPDDREITDIKRKSLEEGTPLLNFENRYLTKNGETRWLPWTSTPLPEEGLIFAVAKDTTEKKKLDEERKRILESISDFFFALDKYSNFTYMNSATEKLFKLNPGALIGKNIWEEWPSFKEGVFFESAQKSITSKEPVSFEFYDKPSDKWFEESFYPSEDGLSVFFRSINDRKMAEKALKEAFKEKDIILESIGDAFFAVDKNWIVTYWNKMSEQLLKVNREIIVGKNVWQVFAEVIPYSFYANYHMAINKNEAVHFEEYYEPLNIWLEVSAYPSLGGLSVYFKDISVRKKAEDSIRTSNERYDLVSKATNDAIWDWDLITNQVIRPGKRLETLFGYVACETHEVNDFWNSHTHPGDWARVTKKRNALFANPAENYWEDEYRFLTTGGEYAFVYDKGYIIRNDDGKAIRMIGASQDVTKEKEQINEIIRIQKNLDSLINTTTDLIWSINTDFKIIAANKAYSDSIQAITGNPVKEGDDVIFPSIETEIKDKWGEFYIRALSGETFHIEESFYNPSIRDPWHTIVSFSPIINKDGKIPGVACFAKDVTELKKAGQKLLELNNSLEKRAEELANSNSELERFAYVASHDLQEPLRMVSSFLQLLERRYNDKLDDTARKYIHFSVDGADRMKQLINDLLQYSSAGTALLEIGPLDMNEVLADTLILFKNEVHTIDAEIIVENLPVIHAGKSAMLQLMQNLVGNALKYRSREKPVVTISGKEEKDEWVFTVKDNGIGIDTKFQDKIFIIFQRLHNKDEFSGTGIGLAICKKIIERYHGKIWVESEFGKGSKFIFAIPKMIN